MLFSQYDRFEVKIVDKKYYAEGDIEYPSTAIVSFFENNKLVTVHDFGYLPTEDIYSLLEKTDTLCLDYCYVRNFSLIAYKRYALIGKTEKVALKWLSAQNAFFDSEYTIDFSYLWIDEGNVNFKGTHFGHGYFDFHNCILGEGKADFSGAVFKNGSVDFSNTIFGQGGVSFKNGIFSSGLKNFQYTDFGKGEITFVNTIFGGGEISFINTNFNEGDVSFKVAQFGAGRVDFHYARFGKGDISFERADFGKGEVDFRTTEFGKGRVNFNRAVFQGGETSFEASSASGKVSFKKTNFGDGRVVFDLVEMENASANFENALFNRSEISFHQAQFESLSLKHCQINGYLDLRVRKCKELDLSDTVIRDIVDLIPYDFPVEVDVLNIAGMRLLGTIYIDWHRNNVKKMIEIQENTSLEQKAEQFRILKESFNKSGQYNDEDYSYVYFKRYELDAMYSMRWKRDKYRRPMDWLMYHMRKLLFDHAGLYATNPIRVILSMITVYVFFSILYSIVQFAGIGGIVSGIGGQHDAIGIVGRSFYHSGITFFTIGYGDFYPLGAVRWISNIEGFTGVFLMSYFTVAFVRKILR